MYPVVRGLAQEQAVHSGFRLLVRSIGTADARVIPSLRRLRATTDSELAGLLYRAPSELLSGLNEDAGCKLRDLLREVGVEVDLVPAYEEYEPGTADYEVAIAITRFDRMLSIIEATTHLLGVDVATAKRLVCASPAVIIGRVSRATVEALRKRFEPLGVEIDVSRTQDAAFDIAAESTDETTTATLATLLATTAIKPAESGTGQFMATGLDAATAERLWSELSRTAAKVRVLNRDFLRFDVRLERAPRSKELADYLVEVTGMAPATADRALSRTPFVLAENVPGPRMVEILTAVRARGGQASGILLALRSFGLALKPGGNREAARVWVESIAGREAGAGFARGLAELPGPFTKTQARWLQHELRTHGIASQLVER